MKKLRRRLPAVGAAPGTLSMHAELPKLTVRRVVYDREQIEESDVPIDQVAAICAPPPQGVAWLDVQGLGDEQALRQIGQALGLNPLTLEDIAHVHQRPKVEEFEDYVFVVLRCVRLLDDGSVDNEQISLVLMDGLLVSFQERSGDGFEPVRKRLREGKGMLRRSKADYLAYALIDVTVDMIFPVLERYSEAMDDIDDSVEQSPTGDTSRAIHKMKRELRTLKRALWPLRDLVGSIHRSETSFVSESVRPALRDCYDHTVQAVDFIEAARERVSDLGDRYIAAMGERTNQVMKVLTIIATIFIPLTYLAGLYGMNFDPEASPYNMPELKLRYGYILFWCAQVLVFLIMLGFFRRQGWIGGRR